MSGVGRPGRNSRQKKAREGGLDGDRQGPWLKPGRSSICESVQLFCEPTTVVPRLRSALLLLRPHMTWQMWVSVLLLTVRHMMREISMAAAQVLVTVICSRSGS